MRSPSILWHGTNPSGIPLLDNVMINNPPLVAQSVTVGAVGLSAQLPPFAPVAVGDLDIPSDSAN